jgi:hypothetical protein
MLRESKKERRRKKILRYFWKGDGSEKYGKISSQ